MKKLLLSALCVATMDACKKEPTVTFLQEEGGTKTAQRTSLVISNGSNPYDFVGELHNEGCDFVFQNGITKETFSRDWIPLVTSFATNKNLAGSSDLPTFFESDEWKESFPQSKPFTQNNAEDVILHMYGKGWISAVESNYLQRLMNVADSFDLILAAQNYDVSSAYAQSYSSFVKIENEVLTSNLSNESEKMLLSVASVGRHSLAHWINTLEDSNGGTMPQERINHVVKADMSGAAAASVSWGLWATFTGGVAGWGAVVFSGAVGNSVYEVLMNM